MESSGSWSGAFLAFLNQVRIGFVTGSAARLSERHLQDGVAPLRGCAARPGRRAGDRPESVPCLA